MVLPGDPNPENLTVVQRMLEFKKDLIARDADTILQMGSRWMRIEDALEANIRLLVIELQEMVATGQVIEIQRIYKLRRYQKLLAQVRTEMSSYNFWAADFITGNQQTLGVLGINHAAEIIQLSFFESGAGAGIFFDKLPTSAFELMVGNAGKGGPVYDLLQTAYPDSVDRMTSALITNIALGIPPGQTAKLMMDGLTEGLNHALTVARTEQLRVYREASRQQYESSGAVKGYKRFAAKDGNTCVMCIALDGEIYPTSELMSVHPNDRCIMIPLVKGVPEPTWESGKDWLRRQDPEIQQQILGPGALELWKGGDIKLMDLVNKTEHPIWGPSLQRNTLESLSQ